MTIIDIENLKSQLSDRLALPLPGIEAHIKMAPPQRFPKNNPYQPNETTRTGCVLLVLFPNEGGELCFPLMLRPEYGGTHSGQVSLPGGKHELEDEDLMHTALREMEEEMGVAITREQVVGQLSTVYIPPSNFLVHPFVAVMEEEPTFTPSENEVAKLFFVNVEELQEDHNRLSKPLKFKGKDIMVPFFQLDNNMVWGATAMMLSEFSFIWEDLKTV